MWGRIDRSVMKRLRLEMGRLCKQRGYLSKNVVDFATRQALWNSVSHAGSVFSPSKSAVKGQNFATMGRRQVIRLHGAAPRKVCDIQVDLKLAATSKTADERRSCRRLTQVCCLRGVACVCMLWESVHYRPNVASTQRWIMQPATLMC